MQERLSKIETEAVQELLDKCGPGPQVIFNDEAADIFSSLIDSEGCECSMCQFILKCLADWRDIH